MWCDKENGERRRSSASLSLQTGAGKASLIHQQCPRLAAEGMLMAMSERDLMASAGAACASGSLEPSPVLLAMGIPEASAHGSIRFSFSRFTTDEEIEAALAIVPTVVRGIATGVTG